MPHNILSAALLLVSLATSNPLSKRGEDLSPVFNENFPDPALIGTGNGGWLAVSTSNGQGNVPSAASSNGLDGPWENTGKDLLPKVGEWSTGSKIWAPDVKRIGDTYVLYYTGEAKDGQKKQCVGSATADTVLGPYTPQKDPIACDQDIGGAIDPAGFVDGDGKNYVLYKVDGNSNGGGGPCGNEKPSLPYYFGMFGAHFALHPTPIMLQEMDSDGITIVGDPKVILDRDDGDGPLIEAPHLIHVDGLYILFFSSNCYNTPLYDISYATSRSLTGPYTKAKEPLAVTNNPFNLEAPGHSQATDDGKNLIFHANCGEGKRCMYKKGIKIEGDIVKFE